MAFSFEYNGQTLSDWTIDQANWPEDATEALRASIVKWETVCQYIEQHDTPPGEMMLQSCALCRLYWHRNCVGCPISDAGHSFCEYTPYEDYEFHSLFDGEPDVDKVLLYAQKEVAFLKQVLEETEEA